MNDTFRKVEAPWHTINCRITFGNETWEIPDVIYQRAIEVAPRRDMRALIDKRTIAYKYILHYINADKNEKAVMVHAAEQFLNMQRALLHIEHASLFGKP